MTTIKAESAAAFVTGDVARIKISPTIVNDDGSRTVLADSNPSEVITARVRSDKRVAITPSILGVLNTTDKAWYFDFSADDTNLFLKDPNDPTSDLKYETVKLEVQIGVQGSVQTLIYPNLKVEKGTIP